MSHSTGGELDDRFPDDLFHLILASVGEADAATDARMAVLSAPRLGPSPGPLLRFADDASPGGVPDAFARCEDHSLSHRGNADVG